MQSKLGKMQKLVLIYVGVKTKSIGKRYMKRRDLTIGLADILLEKRENKFYVAVSQAVTPLTKRGLLSKRGNRIGLTIEGLDTAKHVLDIIERDYGEINWDTIVKYYNRKEESYDRQQ